MFDVPSVSKADMKNYRIWHDFLVKTGFIMMTESVYSRLVPNKSISESIKKLVRNNLPPKGNVQMLEVTEKQFAEIEYCLGERQNCVIDSFERYVEI